MNFLSKYNLGLMVAVAMLGKISEVVVAALDHVKEPIVQGKEGEDEESGEGETNTES